MKKSEFENSKFPIVVDLFDYLSTSMIIKNNHKKSNDTVNDLLSIKTIEKSENSRAFDLFAHILEG